MQPHDGVRTRSVKLPVLSIALRTVLTIPVAMDLTEQNIFKLNSFLK